MFILFYFILFLQIYHFFIFKLNPIKNISESMNYHSQYLLCKLLSIFLSFMIKILLIQSMHMLLLQQNM